MAYTAIPTVATGDTWTAANHNTYLRDNLGDHETRLLAAEAILAKTVRYCSLYKTNANVSTGSIVFNTELVDTGGFWSSGVPTRLMIPANGNYEISYGAYVFGLGDTYYVQLAAYKNGVIFSGYPSAYIYLIGASVTQGSFSQSLIVPLLAGDYITIEFFTDDPGGVSLTPYVTIKQMG